MQTLVTVGAVCLVLGGGVGWWVGDGLAGGACAARELAVAKAYAANQNAAVEAAHRDAAAESERRNTQAVQDARRLSAAREARLKGQIDALKNARAECAAHADRVRLYNDAVDAANAPDATP